MHILNPSEKLTSLNKVQDTYKEITVLKNKLRPMDEWEMLGLILYILTINIVWYNVGLLIKELVIYISSGIVEQITVSFPNVNGVTILIITKVVHHLIDAMFQLSLKKYKKKKNTHNAAFLLVIIEMFLLVASQQTYLKATSYGYTVVSHLKDCWGLKSMLDERISRVFKQINNVMRRVLLKLSLF